MKNKTTVSLLAIISMFIMLIATSCNNSDPNTLSGISFYEVPLVCGADSSIGCGSRIKPLFIKSAEQKEIKESWVNREGTIIAFVWADKQNNDLAEKLLNDLDIDGTLITDEKQIADLTVGMKGTQQWYQGMAVDSLSLHEAGTIAFTTTKAVQDMGLITEEEASAIRPDIESYFKKELVKVRTFEELCQDQKTKWLEDSYQIYVSHIGEERAGKVKAQFSEMWDKKEQEDACKKSCKEKEDCCKKKS